MKPTSDLADTIIGSTEAKKSLVKKKYINYLALLVSWLKLKYWLNNSVTIEKVYKNCQFDEARRAEVKLGLYE